jgi:acetyl esterase/lipase
MFCYERLVPALVTIGVIALSGLELGAQELEIDHRRLDFYLDEDGEKQPVREVEDWEKRRAQVIEGFEAVMGKMPSREELVDLDIKVKESVEEEGYVRHLIDFASVAEDSDRIPAYLYVPEGIVDGKKRAGIVALHPTHKIGKDVVDGLSERPNRGYAKELASLGYVVIAPDYPSFGELSDYDFASDRYKSGTLKAVWNHMRCVDLLQAREDVDGENIGTIGHSLGGHNAIFLGAMDERVKVVVSSCGWTPFRDYKEGDITGWTSDRYMPALREEFDLDPDRVPFDFPELIAAIAPRAFFSNSPLWDSNFDYRGVEKAAPEARRIFELYEVPDKMRIAYPDAQHDFPQGVREESYRFLGKWLGMEETTE